jgi:hypothetical protein
VAARYEGVGETGEDTVERESGFVAVGRKTEGQLDAFLGSCFFESVDALIY